MEKVTKTDAEWRGQLDDLEFKVLRKHGTERAFSNDAFPKDPGTFMCKGCGAPLFDQSHKFSHTNATAAPGGHRFTNR